MPLHTAQGRHHAGAWLLTIAAGLVLAAQAGCARVVANEPFGDPVPAEAKAEARAAIAGVWRHGETLLLCRPNSAGELTLTRVAWDEDADRFKLSPTPMALRMIESAGLGLIFLDDASLDLPGTAGRAGDDQTSWLVLRLVTLQGDAMAVASAAPEPFAALIEAGQLDGRITRDREGRVAMVRLTGDPAQAARVVAESAPDRLFPASRVAALARIARWDELAGEAADSAP